MSINSIPSIAPLLPINQTSETDNTSAGQSTSFSDYLKNALNEVSDLQQQASLSGEKLAMGDENYLHNTVIAYEKANLALQLTIEIRNRLVESFQEIMRMQM
ncbi:MAG TPA: flagellar hook-basal body complex protein FliE [Syntrophomonadaceae bacterium]|nr:flagellar hook-basal body complex protein FliE [Syntrophomonadaceae bacterium]